MPSKKRYYLIYFDAGAAKGNNEDSIIFAMADSEEVAKDWCNRNPYYYYVEKICE